MAIKIGSNVSSLQAQRRLGEATYTLSKTYERLASGQRINTASDDAAALAISESLSSKNRVFAQAIRNLNDGISLFSIAEGAIQELKGIVLRQRELATQASNGSYTVVQRTAIDKERKTLEDEYNRLIKSTSFNGRRVFDESQGQLTLQAGYGDSATLRAAADSTLDYGAATPIRISTDSTGAQVSGGDSSGAGISADARYLIFSSSATNLVAGDANVQSDIFMKDLVTGEVNRINTTSSGAEALGGTSSSGSLSLDGHYAVFSSGATNLVADDTNARIDVFVKDLLNGETRRVSTSGSGGQGIAGASYQPDISADGRYVAFRSDAISLMPTDITPLMGDIYLKDTVTGEIKYASTDAFGNQNSATASNPAMTSDGRYVVFWTTSANLVSGDNNGLADVFRKDLTTGEIIRVSTDSKGNEASGGSTTTSIQITEDGRYVTFLSSATNLVSNDTNGQSDIFLKDLVTGEMKRINTDSSGNEALGAAGNGRPSLSADGRFVVFESTATNLVGNDTNASADIFIKDVLTGATRRLNTDALGNQASGGDSSAPQITPDGRYIVFSSAATNLVSNDSNAAEDIFLVANPFAERFSLSLCGGLSLHSYIVPHFYGPPSSRSPSSGCWFACARIAAAEFCKICVRTRVALSAAMSTFVIRAPAAEKVSRIAEMTFVATDRRCCIAPSCP